MSETCCKKSFPARNPSKEELSVGKPTSKVKKSKVKKSKEQHQDVTPNVTHNVHRNNSVSNEDVTPLDKTRQDKIRQEYYPLQGARN